MGVTCQNSPVLLSTAAIGDGGYCRSFIENGHFCAFDGTLKFSMIGLDPVPWKLIHEEIMTRNLVALCSVLFEMATLTQCSHFLISAGPMALSFSECLVYPAIITYIDEMISERNKLMQKNCSGTVDGGTDDWWWLAEAMLDVVTVHHRTIAIRSRLMRMSIEYCIYVT